MRHSTLSFSNECVFTLRELKSISRSRLNIASIGFGFALLMLVVLAPKDATAQSNFVMVTNADGSSTSLRQKLVTQKRVGLRPTPSNRAEGPQVPPYYIFYQLKASSGREVENVFLRVGDEPGRFSGWNEDESLVRWSTRYAIQPRASDQPANRFSVKLKGRLHG